MTTITPTADGGSVQTFITANAGDGSETLHVQKLDAGGQAVGSEFTATQYAPFMPVAVTPLSDGGYVVGYGYAFRGDNWSVGVFDASGSDLRTFGLSGYGDGLVIAASPEGGFLLADRGTVSEPGGIDYAGHPRLTLYDNAGDAVTSTATLTGDMPSITVAADGHYQVSWTDGNLTHTLDYDPANPPDFSQPSAPAVQVIDDEGAQQGALPDGGQTDDPTPTLRVAVSHTGFIDVVFGQGVQDDPKELGGVQVSAADVARGYVDIPEQAGAAGTYDAFVHFKSDEGVASAATHVSFIDQPATPPPPTPTPGPAPTPPPPPVPASDGQVLTGHAGGDTLMGGIGDDTITGQSGSNYLRGGDGDDAISGGIGFNDINGNKGDDTIVGHSVVGDWLVGGQGDDVIQSHGDDNILYGNLGDDTLTGSGGGEILRGGQGDDSIVAGSGAEWLSGDRGDDTIQGGAGPDVFHTFAGAGLDVVLGFDAAKGDHVQLDPGATYVVSQLGGDVAIQLGGADEMILRGVRLATLPDGWIFTG